MSGFDLESDDDRPAPLRSFTHEEVRKFCVWVKRFTEQLERQLIIGEMDAEREACISLHREADNLQSLLP